MRRLLLILVPSLFVAMIAWELYDFLVTNNGVRYYSSEPRRLVVVVLLSIAAGIVAFGISRLSPGSQRSLKLATLGTLGIFLLCALGLSACFLVRADPMVGQRGIWVWVVVGFAVTAVLVGLEFRHAWKRT